MVSNRSMRFICGGFKPLQGGASDMVSNRSKAMLLWWFQPAQRPCFCDSFEPPQKQRHGTTIVTTISLKWLEHLRNHENIFETGLVRANEC